MSTVTLGFDGGPSVAFRHDPTNVAWNFKINTAVQQTIGGRVVQVTGATLSDLTIDGSFGERKATAGAGPSLSWEIAEKFHEQIRNMMVFQSRDSTTHQKMHPPAIFSYPPKGWRFGVYIKGLTDPDGGGSINHRTGKFAHGYRLSLFIVDDRSQNLIKAGHGSGVIASQREAAIKSYISRISDGIGWKYSDAFNGRSLDDRDGVSSGAAVQPSGRKADVG